MLRLCPKHGAERAPFCSFCTQAARRLKAVERGERSASAVRRLVKEALERAPGTPIAPCKPIRVPGQYPAPPPHAAAVGPSLNIHTPKEARSRNGYGRQYIWGRRLPT